jgi:23S rRNA pseudouridine955/2504/2580 synthase
MKWQISLPTRLSSFLKEKCPSFTHADLHWAIERQRCWVNERVERFASFKLKRGDLVHFWPIKKPCLEREPGRIIYEDEGLLVYNKPPFIDTPMLVKELGLHLVHRLDRDTSGILLCAKDPQMQQALEQLFRQRAIQKEYFALVLGDPGESGTIQGRMACAKKREGASLWQMGSSGLFSMTFWSKIAQGKGHSFLLCQPKTGRTHQIRLHLQSIGAPLLGDVDYGSKKGVDNLFRQQLHAHSLAFIHPFTQKKMHFIAPEENDFAYWKEQLLNL